MREAINTFISAINFIKAEADPQNNDLFVIDYPVQEQRYRDVLADLNGALDGTGYIREIWYQVNLSEFFDRPKTLRNYLPHFIKQFIEADTFPDPTFGGILPSMTPNELNKRLWDYIIYPEALLWISVSPPVVSSNWSLTAVHFTSSNEGWAIGQDWGDFTSSKGVLIRYFNGTWTPVSPPAESPGFFWGDVHFISSNEGWAVGSRDVLLHYYNGLWRSVKIPGLRWMLKSVHFTSASEGWAVGADMSDMNLRGLLLRFSPAISEVILTATPTSPRAKVQCCV